MKTDLILISHNSKKDLERFLPSIEKYTKDFTITIVDNGSDDETVKYLENLEKEVIYQENKGYGSACNVGAKATTSEFIVFLNCDLLASEGWLEKLLEPFKDEKVAITGARLMAPNDVEFPTPEIDWVCGAVMAMRRSAFDKLGGLDENFFLFWEETDLCKRAVDAGYKVIRSDAKLIHYHPHFPPFKDKLKEYWDQSEAYFKKKHNIKPLILIAIPAYKDSDATFLASILNVAKYGVTGFDLEYLILPNTVIHDARNKAVLEAKNLKADYILFIDNDMSFPSDTLQKLVDDIQEKQADIVCGLFFKREPPYAPTSLLRLEKTNDKEIGFTSLKEWPEGLVEIDGCGMAFTLIDMKLFDRVKYPWFAFREEVGEDLYLCFNAKIQAKAKMYCDTRIHVGHIGRHIVGIRTYQAWQEQKKKQELEDLGKLEITNL